MPRSKEIICTACGARSMTRAEPVYEGFKKVGEQFFCLHCGHCYPSEAETPFVQPDDTRPKIFTDQDKPEKPAIFSEDERHHSCAWCRHFVVNPFTQRCGLTNAFTEATHLCLRFEKRETDPEKSGDAATPDEP
ncbi:MAG: hypothetical protein J6334_00165 [Kiritimatiellae bacterium]|nr:hypothetical protein [Kiritimatiellia bacterium]